MTVLIAILLLLVFLSNLAIAYFLWQLYKVAVHFSETNLEIEKSIREWLSEHIDQLLKKTGLKKKNLLDEYPIDVT